MARDAGYRGYVMKSHVELTASRAKLARTHSWPEGQIFGAIVLNRAVGGLDPRVVANALTLGARVIWMPTLSAAAGHGAMGMNDPDPIAIEADDLTEDGPVAVICALIAEHDATLATGHLSPEEVLRLAPFAQRHGVTRIIVTHPEFPTTAMSMDVQLELAALGGVWFERCLNSFTPEIGADITALPDFIRTVGYESTILATDFGQSINPAPTEGMRSYLDHLSGKFPRDQLEYMCTVGPAIAAGAITTASVAVSE
jgi:hypothetical protein